MEVIFEKITFLPISFRILQLSLRKPSLQNVKVHYDDNPHGPRGEPSTNEKKKIVQVSQAALPEKLINPQITPLVYLLNLHLKNYPEVR